MNARILTASVLLASAIATAQSQVTLGDGAIGCTEAGARLDDGTPVAADITFDYDPSKAWLQVIVSNKTPVVAEVASPTITRIYFNAPTGTLTGASLMWQLADGPTQPTFLFGFDADAGDGADPNSGDCFGTFNFCLAATDIKGGIASADAEFICGGRAAPPLRGPVKFVFQLVGTAENVRIILGKTAHPNQAVQHAAFLVTVNCAEFCQSERQFAVTVFFCFIDQDMPRTVHRFNKVVLAVNIHGRIHAVAVMG